MVGVYAGRARILSLLPRSPASRAYYQDLFVKMSGKIVALQKPDGSWAPSLLDPSAGTPPETSGTGFFTYAGLGCSCRNFERSGLPARGERGWSLLGKAVQPDGKLAGSSKSAASPIRLVPTIPSLLAWALSCCGLGHIRSCRQALSGSSLWRTRPVTGESSRPFLNRFEIPTCGRDEPIGCGNAGKTIPHWHPGTRCRDNAVQRPCNSNAGMIAPHRPPAPLLVATRLAWRESRNAARTPVLDQTTGRTTGDVQGMAGRPVQSGARSGRPARSRRRIATDRL